MPAPLTTNASWEYPLMGPLSRSRRRSRTFAPRTGGCRCPAGGPAPNTASPPAGGRPPTAPATAAPRMRNRYSSDISFADPVSRCRPAQADLGSGPYFGSGALWWRWADSSLVTYRMQPQPFCHDLDRQDPDRREQRGDQRQPGGHASQQPPLPKLFDIQTLPL